MQSVASLPMSYQQTETMLTLTAALGISRSTWRRLAMAGEIPPPVMGEYPRPCAGSPRVQERARWDSRAVFAAMGREDLARKVA